MANHAAARTMTRLEEASQPVLAPSSVRDISLARASVAAIRATPGVADVSPGLIVLAATYGPHERVVGVVVRHASPHDTAVEVHIIAARETISDIATHGGGSEATPEDASEVAVLAQVASRVRAAVYRVASSMNLVPLPAVDVFIDDIQVPGALDCVPAQ